MAQIRPSRANLVQALLILGAAAIVREVAARPDVKTTTFKGVRPRPSPDHTFRGA